MEVSDGRTDDYLPYMQDGNKAHRITGITFDRSDPAEI
jgi:hypothetical protein